LVTVFLLSRPAFLAQTETSVETFHDRAYCIIKESLNPGQNGFVAALCFSRAPLPPRPEVPLPSHSIPCTALVVLKAIDKHTHAEEAPENKLHHTKREFKLLQWATPMLLSSIQTQTQLQQRSAAINEKNTIRFQDENPQTINNQENRSDSRLCC
jgi:hypothetical protein